SARCTGSSPQWGLPVHEIESKYAAAVRSTRASPAVAHAAAETEGTGANRRMARLGIYRQATHSRPHLRNPQKRRCYRPGLTQDRTESQAGKRNTVAPAAGIRPLRHRVYDFAGPYLDC